jgi:hypothetical protein
MLCEFNNLLESLLVRFGLLLEADEETLKEISDKAEEMRKQRLQDIVDKKPLSVRQKHVHNLIILRDFLKDELAAPTTKRPFRREVSDQELDKFIVKIVKTKFEGLRHLHSSILHPERNHG